MGSLTPRFLTSVYVAPVTGGVVIKWDLGEPIELALPVVSFGYDVVVVDGTGAQRQRYGVLITGSRVQSFSVDADTGMHVDDRVDAVDFSDESVGVHFRRFIPARADQIHAVVNVNREPVQSDFAVYLI